MIECPDRAKQLAVAGGEQRLVGRNGVFGGAGTKQMRPGVGKAGRARQDGNALGYARRGNVMVGVVVGTVGKFFPQGCHEQDLDHENQSRRVQDDKKGGIVRGLLVGHGAQFGNVRVRGGNVTGKQKGRDNLQNRHELPRVSRNDELQRLDDYE